MKAGYHVKAALCGLSILALASCNDTDGFGKQSFKAQYFSARTSLEKGDYTKANRQYARLMTQAGPFADRIQLEYAHSHLRAGDYGKAASMARDLTAQGKGSSRGAALAVLGTAEHEIGLSLLAKGDHANGAARLKSAQKALSEVLADHPDLDPLGSLAGRNAAIQSRLKSLP